MKNVFTMMFLALLLVNASFAQCPPGCQTSTTLNFATGVNGGGGLLNPGDFDGNWLITNAPPSANLGPLPAIPLVIARYGGATGWGYQSPADLPTLQANGNWISPFPSSSYSTNNPVPNPPFTFTFTFCTCQDDDFNFDGLLNSDDIATVDVDGTTLVSSTNWQNIFPFNQNVFLPAGVHTINIHLRNTGGTAMGVNVSGVISSLSGASIIANQSCCNNTGAVNGIKYSDVNNNGVIDGADTVIENWTFTLNGTGGGFAAPTNQYGAFNFANIPPGTYTLAEPPVPGWTPVTPSGGSTTVTVTAGNVTTVNFLNRQGPTETRGCCDEIENDNLVVNGSFEAGNTGFSTGAYTYQSSITQGSVTEGMYSVVSGNEASTISNCWNVPDHTSCTTAGHFMVVNGRTHYTGPISPLYSQTINVDANEEYVFCMYYRHLPQCEFDIFDPANLNIQVLGATITGDACEDDEDHCGWTKVSYSVTPSGSTVTISITLNEAGIGDGNDVAFDDISLRKKQAMTVNYCAFDFASTTLPNGDKNITVTEVNTAPAGFNVVWTVSEIDCNTGVVIGGTTATYTTPGSTNFPGYGGTTPGTFDQNKCYRVTRDVSSCCYVPCQDYWNFQFGQSLLMMGVENDPPIEKDKLYYSKDRKTWAPVAELPNGTATTTGIDLYPNPGDGVVMIEADHSLKNAALTVYSADGKVVLRQSITGAKGNINISKLASGIYSFEITEPDGKVTFKKYVKK